MLSMKKIAQVLRVWKEGKMPEGTDRFYLTPKQIPEEEQFFSKLEIQKLEEEYPRGIPAQMIVELFQAKGVRFSMPTFRKYVQSGFIGTGTRTGKGEALYPLLSIRRIEFIKYLVKQKIDLSEIKIKETSVPNLWEYYTDSFNSARSELKNLIEEQFDDEEVKKRFDLIKEALDRIADSQRIYNEATDGIPLEKVYWSQMDQFYEIVRTNPEIFKILNKESDKGGDTNEEK